MLKRITVSCLACMLIVAFLFLPGCGGDKQGQESADKQGQAQTGTSGGELERLLAKSKAINEIFFEITVTYEGKEELSGKTWIKGNKFKNEFTVEGTTSSYICDPDKNEAYIYFDDRKEAILMEFEPQMTDWLFSPANVLSTSLQGYPAKIVGTETYDGHKCKVIVISPEEGVEAKMWVWEEHGVPLRVEDKSEVQGERIIEYKNVVVGPSAVPDSVFEIPLEYKIEDRRSSN